MSVSLQRPTAHSIQPTDFAIEGFAGRRVLARHERCRRPDRGFVPEVEPSVATEATAWDQALGARASARVHRAGSPPAGNAHLKPKLELDDGELSEGTPGRRRGHGAGSAKPSTSQDASALGAGNPESRIATNPTSRRRRGRCAPAIGAGGPQLCVRVRRDGVWASWRAFLNVRLLLLFRHAESGWAAARSRCGCRGNHTV